MVHIFFTKQNQEFSRPKKEGFMEAKNDECFAYSVSASEIVAVEYLKCRNNMQNNVICLVLWVKHLTHILNT